MGYEELVSIAYYYHGMYLGLYSIKKGSNQKDRDEVARNCSIEDYDQFIIHGDLFATLIGDTWYYGPLENSYKNEPENKKKLSFPQLNFNKMENNNKIDSNAGSSPAMSKEDQEVCDDKVLNIANDLFNQHGPVQTNYILRGVVSLINTRRGEALAEAERLVDELKKTYTSMTNIF